MGHVVSHMLYVTAHDHKHSHPHPHPHNASSVTPPIQSGFFEYGEDHDWLTFISSFFDQSEPNEDPINN